MATVIVLKKIKIGDKIKTNYFESEKEIVRTVTGVVKNEFSQSGILINCDGGDPCEKCGLSGNPIYNIDVAWITWFQAVDNG